jgi:hypothetical protein
MQLSTSHSAFKDSMVIFGNAITNHQLSVYFAVEDIIPKHGLIDEKNGKLYLNTMSGRWYGTTKEKRTEDNLNFLRPYLSHHMYKQIIEKALACNRVCAGLIRTKGKVYGYFVMDGDSKIIASSCFVNNYKAVALVEQFIKTLQQDKQKSVLGQIDHVSMSIKSCVEQSERQQLQNRLNALQVELSAINGAMYC